jgi:hypothetical protein
MSEGGRKAGDWEGEGFFLTSVSSHLICAGMHALVRAHARMYVGMDL